MGAMVIGMELDRFSWNGMGLRWPGNPCVPTRTPELAHSQTDTEHSMFLFESADSC